MLGDGIRRDFATISDEERTLFVNAIRSLDDPTSLFVYPNNLGHEGADGSGNITYWDMQEQIHKDAHVHGSNVHFGPGFVPWHRVLVNRLEGLLRKVEPRLSLHYWDWTTDPRQSLPGRAKLFTHACMGDDGSEAINRVPADGGGDAGVPFQDFESTEGGGHNFIWRNVGASASKSTGEPAIDSDATILAPLNFTAFDNLLKNAHDNVAHSYIGGTLLGSHFSFHDPFVFLLHSNLDRIWATWQRAPGHQDRLDPARAYGTIATDQGFPPNYFDEWVQPWAGIASDGTGGQTDLNPWKSDPSQQAHVPYNDPSVVIPASYDTAPHTSYFIVNQDTVSSTQVATLGMPATIANAFSVVYDGFEPRELGVAATPLPTVPPNLPAFTFAGAGNVSAINPVASYEDPSGAIDMPQRIMVAYDLQFTNANDFPTTAGAEVFVGLRATLAYTVDTGTGGATVNRQEVAGTTLVLVDQPNPYMLDIDSTMASPNPYWLSTDTRVFQVKGPGGGNPAGSVAGVTQGDADTDPNAPFTFIQGVLSSLRSDPSQFVTQLSQDESASTLELARRVGPQRVYNYAVAKVRYRAPLNVDATNVQVFFRAFSTMVSALDYDATAGSAGNYRRTGNTTGAISLLGIETTQAGDAEIASIPFFAEARQPAMASQTDATNLQPITGTGGEQVAFFGCWLDLNQTDLRFPANPLTDPNGPNGPFTGTTPGNPLQSIQQLIRGYHQCLVAEIFFWPSGTTADPIPHDSSPASSDRLAQRNLSIVESSNPGWPEAHTVQHTFLVRPTPVFRNNVPTDTAKRARGDAAPNAAIVIERSPGPDELIVHWTNIPRQSTATFFFPEVDVNEILALSALRQHPTVLTRLDAHTLACRVSDVTFIPLPGGRKGNLAGLMSVTLPPGVRTGQIYRLSVEQYSGVTRKTQGAFQMTIPVRTDPEILPKEIRKLAVLRYIHQTIPVGSRWHSIFVRYLDQIAARVRALGCDPATVEPSPDGGPQGKTHPQPCPPEVDPRDLLCLNIPWRECEIEGEIELKLRFRKRCQ